MRGVSKRWEESVRNGRSQQEMGGVREVSKRWEESVGDGRSQ